jgi:phage-related protein
MHGVRPALFHPKALEAIRSFPKSARREMGESILELQKGSHLTMPRSRPIPAVGPGVQEIRVRDAAGIYRAFYLQKSERGVMVFHAFEKRSAKTPRSEIELGRSRLREMPL